MPEVDGFSATSQIRESEKKSGAHIPIIAMTARALAGDRERCLAAGMDGYVAKPIHKEDLLGAISLCTAIQPVSASCDRPHDFLAHFDGDADLLRKVSRVFTEQSRIDLDAMRSAIASRDKVVLGRTAHKLIGSLGVFGADQAIRKAQKLEQLAEKEDFDESRALLTQLENEVDTVQSRLAVIG